MSRETEAELDRYREHLIWCGGSEDFQQGGKARLGWLRGPAQLLWGTEKANAQIAHEFPHIIPNSPDWVERMQDNAKK